MHLFFSIGLSLLFIHLGYAWIGEAKTAIMLGGIGEILVFLGLWAKLGSLPCGGD